MLTLSFNPFPEIETERLVLRNIRQDDVNEIFFLRSDKNVLKFLDREPAPDVQAAAKWIEKIWELEENNEAITWAITIKNSAALIGTICFWNIAKEHYRAEIGYALHPAHQQKGIMQEAATAVIKFGFEKMNLHSIEANVNPQNIPSIKLLEKNNFVREGYFKENYFFNGAFGDSTIYSLMAPK